MTEFGGVRVLVGLSCDLCVLNLNEHLCCAVIRDCVVLYVQVYVNTTWICQCLGDLSYHCVMCCMHYSWPKT